MANAMVKPGLGYALGRLTDVRKTPNTATNSWSSTFDAGTVDMTALDARLTAISGTLYTAAYLRTISLNDKIYALRMNDDNASIDGA